MSSSSGSINRLTCLVIGKSTEPQSLVPKQKAKPTPGHIGIRPQQLTGTSSFLATNTM